MIPSIIGFVVASSVRALEVTVDLVITIQDMKEQQCKRYRKP